MVAFSSPFSRFHKHWLFWVGPFLGGIIGAFSYEFVFNPRRRTFASYTNAALIQQRTGAYVASHVLQPPHLMGMPPPGMMPVRIWCD